MIPSSLRRIPALLAALVTASALADEPIFNEMPRWSDGWGFQWVNEFRSESDLLEGETAIGPGFSEDIHILHLEGVYTWHRSIRLTAKFPYVISAEREVLGPGGGKITQRDHGFGDATFALPLKKYFNLDGRSGSWTLAPQVRVPFARDDEYAVFDNQWGNGLSLGYGTESFKYHFGASVTGWVFYGDDPDEAMLSIDAGRNVQAFGSSGYVKWETDLMYEADGTLTLAAGPALYWRITDTVHGRVDWKHDFYDRQSGQDHGNGDTVRIGIGFVF